MIYAILKKRPPVENKIIAYHLTNLKLKDMQQRLHVSLNLDGNIFAFSSPLKLLAQQ